MILSFACKDTEKLFNNNFVKTFHSFARPAKRKLNVLHASQNLGDLKSPPGNNLEQLTGDRRHQYSIRINKQWRICFSWKDNNAYNVEIVDYH